VREEDTNDRGMFLTGSFSTTFHPPTATRLGNYISAGGMRSLRPDRFADQDARSRRCFLRLTLGLSLLWLIFLLLPCT
jgi:hypothetical protein